MASIHKRNKRYMKRHKWADSKFGKTIRVRIMFAPMYAVMTLANGYSQINRIKASHFNSDFPQVFRKAEKSMAIASAAIKTVGAAAKIFTEAPKGR